MQCVQKHLSWEPAIAVILGCVVARGLYSQDRLCATWAAFLAAAVLTAAAVVLARRATCCKHDVRVVAARAAWLSLGSVPFAFGIPAEYASRQERQTLLVAAIASALASVTVAALLAYLSAVRAERSGSARQRLPESSRHL